MGSFFVDMISVECTFFVVDELIANQDVIDFFNSFGGFYWMDIIGKKEEKEMIMFVVVI